MSNTMKFVGEEEHFPQNPHEQHNLPVCWCNGALNLEGEWFKQFLDMVGRKVEEVIDRKLPSTSSSLPPQAEPSVSKTFRLCLKGTMPDTILTMDNIEDQDASLELQLCDDTGKRVVEVDPEMKNLKVMISVLEDFKFDDSDNFTVEAFESKIAKPREGKPQLLKGNYEISLINGYARVHGISFMDNSAKRSGGKFKLGARVIKGIPFGKFVRPAVSEAFQVKEYWLKGDLKHPKPFPQDDISRLANITKTGDQKCYQRAKAQEIFTVLDFLQLYYTDATKLQNNLKLTGKRWKKTVENAEACNLTNELYKYEYFDDASGDVLLMNCAFKIESVTFKDQPSQPYESLNQFQKEKVCELRKTAYEKRKELKKVYTSTNQTPIQARLRHPCHVQQPATAPFSMDSNVSVLWGSAGVTGVSSYNMDSTSLLNTGTDQGSFGQQSACAITEYGEKVCKSRQAAYEKCGELEKVDASSLIPVQDVLKGSYDVERQTQQQATSTLPPSSNPSAYMYLDNCQQNVMYTSAFSSTGAYGVHNAVMGVGNHTNVAIENMNQQVANGGFAWSVPDSTANNQDINHQGVMSASTPCWGQTSQLNVPQLNNLMPQIVPGQTWTAPYAVTHPSGNHESSQMCSSNSFSNRLPVDPTPLDQGNMYESSPGNVGSLKGFERLDSIDYDQLFILTTPPQEERSNGSACVSNKSKLITAKIVIRAVTLFMMSVQQNPASASPTKKRKLR